MKTLKILLIYLCLISFFGCGDDSDPSNISVERYVELLKKDDYDASELPNFTSKDIPALLTYRNESQLIKDFPVNMISSYWLPDCNLGMYVLWTIESIRARAIDSEYLIGTFPSQNPIVEKRDNPSSVVANNEIQELIAKSYFDWWEINKNKDFDLFKEIDPLKDTEFRWH